MSFKFNLFAVGMAMAGVMTFNSEVKAQQEYSVEFKIIKVNDNGTIYSYKESKSEFITHPFSSGICAKTYIIRLENGDYGVAVACSDGNNHNTASVSCDPYIVGDSSTRTLLSNSEKTGFIVGCKTTNKQVRTQWNFDNQTSSVIRNKVASFLNYVFEKLNANSVDT